MSKCKHHHSMPFPTPVIGGRIASVNEGLFQGGSKMTGGFERPWGGGYVRYVYSNPRHL
jgi:hypothetical protein